ncbi:hypothetical protein FZEAL_5895 [Fusarium zealandicum]|uniref:Apple domain-containing protein n=1 Tax=Fusarium zealandicum TaxID=1053134 RepID=A0A8H4XK52_9HYPO|nr:hypothetical protein FZEAL_5895 [Fusarium zealandicum]
MRSAWTLAALALSGTLDLASASVCKPHRSVLSTSTESDASGTTTTSGLDSSTTETKGSTVVKNIMSNGNFALRDSENPSIIPGFSIQGQAEIVENKGYTGDGSKEKGCVEMSASENSPSKRKRGIGNIVSISQQLDNLDVKKKYTVRFFYAVVTSPASINVCFLNAYIGGHEFFTTVILSVGQGIEWNTVLTQSDVPAPEAAFSISMNCIRGDFAMIYVDSIFMSNQVTPENINNVVIDYGNDGDITTTTTSARDLTTSETLAAADSTASTSHSTETGMGSESLSGDVTSTQDPTESTDTSNGPDTLTWDTTTSTDTTKGPSTASWLPTQSTESPNGPNTPTWEATTSTDTTKGPSTASWLPTQSTESRNGPNTPAQNPATTGPLDSATTETLEPISTRTLSPSGSRVCPAGAPPPGYCTPVLPKVTQTVSLPGVEIMSDNDQPVVPRACWAYGVPKTGLWGRAKWSKPRQNSIADCALLCKQEGSACKAFAYNIHDTEDPSCYFLNDRIGISGINLNRPWSLIWNDFDCFECNDCDILNSEDVKTESTETTGPSTSTLSFYTSILPSSEVAMSTTTISTPSETASCPSCRHANAPPSNAVCEKIGKLSTGDLEPYANNNYDKATLQTTSEQCATICFQLAGCRASSYDYARRRCIFTNTELTNSVFQQATDQNPSDYVLPWSSTSCWTCSTDCSLVETTASLSSPERTTSATQTQITTTFESSVRPSTTVSESVMPACTLALSDGCLNTPDYDSASCNRQGTFRRSFVLEENEYPWADDNWHCQALCNQIPDRCQSSAWDQNVRKCRFSSQSISDSSFSAGTGSDDLYWSEQSCYRCFCHDRDRNDYLASLATATPTATCSVSFEREDAICELKQNPESNLLCEHDGYFPWAYDRAPLQKFPHQDSVEQCAAICEANPDCQASAWSAESGRCVIGYHELQYITWQEFGNDLLTWSDKGCWDCPDCVQNLKWRV